MKKKFIIYGLSTVLVILALTACGSHQPDQLDESDTVPVTQIDPVSEPIPEPEPPAVPAPEPVADKTPAAPVPELAEEQPPEESPEIVELFTDTNETVYATGTVNIRESYSSDSTKLGSLSVGQSVTRTGVGKEEASGWSRVTLSDGRTAYINNSYLSTTKPVVQQQNTSKPTQNNNNGGGTTQQTPPKTETPKTPTTPSQPKEEPPTPAPAPTPSQPSGGSSQRSGQGPSRQRTNEELESGGTSGSDFIYH